MSFDRGWRVLMTSERKYGCGDEVCWWRGCVGRGAEGAQVVETMIMYPDRNEHSCSKKDQFLM